MSGFHMCCLLWAFPEPQERRNSINYEEVESRLPVSCGLLRAILPQQMGPGPAFGSAWFNLLIILGEDMGAKDGLQEARVIRSRGLGGSWIILTDHAMPSISFS